MQSKYPGKDICHREDAEELACYRGHQAVDSIAESLEDGADDDTISCEDEAEADQTQGRYTDFQHVLGCIKHKKKLSREKLEDHNADHHDGDCNKDTQPCRVHNPLLVSCSVVVGDDGDHSVVETEYWHEDKALQLEVHAKYSNRRGGEGNQDQVHSVSHHGCDGLHNNGRNAYFINNPDNSSVWPEAAHVEADVIILLQIENQGQESSQNLTDYRCQRRTADAKRRKSQQSKDQNRIQNDIGDSAYPLGVHIVDSTSCGLQDTLQCHFHEKTNAENCTDQKILYSVFNNQRIAGLALEIHAGADDAKQRKGKRTKEGKEDSVDCRKLGILWFSLAQRAGKQRIDTDAGTDRYGDHQVLNRECHGYGGQRFLANLGNEYAVNDVVHRLHQHRDNHGKRHGYQ